jgi:hypothetical protein
MTAMTSGNDGAAMAGHDWQRDVPGKMQGSAKAAQSSHGKHVVQYLFYTGF